jgi:hypothetical protein
VSPAGTPYLRPGRLRMPRPQASAGLLRARDLGARFAVALWAWWVLGGGNEVPPILWCSLAVFSNAATTSGAVEFSIGSLSGCRHP